MKLHRTIYHWFAISIAINTNERFLMLHSEPCEMDVKEDINLYHSGAQNIPLETVISNTENGSQTLDSLPVPAS